jgi:hypothetical protein
LQNFIGLAKAYIFYVKVLAAWFLVFRADYLKLDLGAIARERVNIRLFAIRRLAMRFRAKVSVAALAIMPVLLTQTPATALPCDNTRWCAQYGGSAGGGTNCGFFTIEQCRATVSGIGGFCVPNQFYNPCGSAGRRSSRHRY